MSTPVIGQPGALVAASPPTQVQLSGGTNTTPISLVTAIPHGFPDGSYVTVVGVTGLTNANGSWQIHVTSTTTFDLVGSVGNSAFLGGGFPFCVSAALPALPAPSDGEKVTAASVGVTFQAVADALAMLWLRMQWAAQLRVGGVQDVFGSVLYHAGAVISFLASSVVTFSTTVTFDSSSSVSFAGLVAYGSLARVTGRRSALSGLVTGTQQFNAPTSDIWQVVTLTGNLVLEPNITGVPDETITRISRMKTTLVDPVSGSGSTFNCIVNTKPGGTGLLTLLGGKQSFIDIQFNANIGVAGEWEAVGFGST